MSYDTTYVANFPPTADISRHSGLADRKSWQFLCRLRVFRAHIYDVHTSGKPRNNNNPAPYCSNSNSSHSNSNVVVAVIGNCDDDGVGRHRKRDRRHRHVLPAEERSQSSEEHRHHCVDQLLHDTLARPPPPTRRVANHRVVGNAGGSAASNNAMVSTVAFSASAEARRSAPAKTSRVLFTNVATNNGDAAIVRVHGERGDVCGCGWRRESERDSVAPANDTSNNQHQRGWGITTQQSSTQQLDTASFRKNCIE